MEQEIVSGNLGTVGKYDVEIKGVDLCVSGQAEYGFGSTSIEQKIHMSFVLDALKKAIPGTFDDALIDLAKKALGL